MSTSVQNGTTPPPTPKSSKKRKVQSEILEPLKKKRKHDKVENGHLTSQESETPKKDKKKNKKDKKDVVAEEVPTAEETEDIELPDAPAQSSPAALQITNGDTEETNGIEADDSIEEVVEIDDTLLQSLSPSCFYEKRLSLQLPIPGISLNSPKESLLSLHLAPLLLTYFPPTEGIVLSFSDPVLSAKPSPGVNLALERPESGEIPRNPPAETFARCADAFGICWVWLTITFLVFRPETGDELRGWTNVTSEGFVGLVTYNYFQTAVGKNRVPKSWTWNGPIHEKKRRARRGKLRDENGMDGDQEETADTQQVVQDDGATEAGSGSFLDASGKKVLATQTFKVVDVEMVPGHERDKWTLQIEGSLLSKEEEAVVVNEERQRFEMQSQSRHISKTPGFDADGTLMSGALPSGVGTDLL